MLVFRPLYFITTIVHLCQSLLISTSLKMFGLCLRPFASVASVHVLPTQYSSVKGSLAHFLKTRADVLLLVSYLCAYNQTLLEGHYRRALHVLRYLASTLGVGPVFKSLLVELVIFSNSAYMFCDGFSSSAHMFCIGRHNASFAVSARAQSVIATCLMTAEHYSANNACKNTVFYRQLLHELGWSSDVLKKKIFIQY
jgi:hypothetical protein